MPKQFHISIRSAIVTDGKLLLLKFYDKTRDIVLWDLPGGRMEEGEAIVDTLQRELQEELPGVQNIAIKHLVGVYKSPRNLHDGSGLMMIIYRVSAQVPAECLLSDEHCGYRWIAVHELDDLADEAEINDGFKELLYEALDL